MNTHTPLAADVRIAAGIRERIIESGLAEGDPDFETILETEAEDTLDRLRRMMRAARWAEKQADALGEIIKDGRERKSRLEAKAEQIRSVVQWALGEIGLDKLEAPDFTASLRAGPPSVVITDELALPDEYVRVKREPDKTALKAALKEGAAIPGASLSNGGVSLSARWK